MNNIQLICDYCDEKGYFPQAESEDDYEYVECVKCKNNPTIEK